jgi:hypothetical protein
MFYSPKKNEEKYINVKSLENQALRDRLHQEKFSYDELETCKLKLNKIKRQH